MERGFASQQASNVEFDVLIDVSLKKFFEETTELLVPVLRYHKAHLASL